jgi:hypothetical protein
MLAGRYYLEALPPVTNVAGVELLEIYLSLLQFESIAHFSGDRLLQQIDLCDRFAISEPFLYFLFCLQHPFCNADILALMRRFYYLFLQG